MATSALDIAGLSKYGVSLSEEHVNGYSLRPDFVYEDKSGCASPWEANLREAAGVDTVAMCKTAEEWNNDEFLFEIRDGIAYCTLNRPVANNAMNDHISAGLHDAERILRSRPDIRVAVLTGNGRMFCAGGDPKSFQAGAMAVQPGEMGDGGVPSGAMITFPARSTEAGKAGTDQFSRDMLGWSTLPQFTICCVNGSAMGAGVGLMCNCDMVIAVKNAHCTLSEVKLGTISPQIAPHIARTIGMANAQRLMCTAENCNMQMALQYGLVQRVVNDSSEFPKVVKEVCGKIQAVAPQALANSKKMILESLNAPMTQKLINHSATEYVKARKDKECEAGLGALRNKQRPYWVEKAIACKE